MAVYEQTVSTQKQSDQGLPYQLTYYQSKIAEFANSVDLDEVAQNEKNFVVYFLVVKELISNYR